MYKQINEFFGMYLLSITEPKANTDLSDVKWVEDSYNYTSDDDEYYL